MTRVLRWPVSFEQGTIIHLPVNPDEQICRFDKSPPDYNEPASLYQLSVWTTDHLPSDIDRSPTGWDRSFVIVLTGEDTPPGFDTWRGTCEVGSYVFHLFEKGGEDYCF